MVEADGQPNRVDAARGEPGKIGLGYPAIPVEFERLALVVGRPVRGRDVVVGVTAVLSVCEWLGRDPLLEREPAACGDRGKMLIACRFDLEYSRAGRTEVDASPVAIAEELPL